MNQFVVYLKSLTRRWFHTHCWSLMVVTWITSDCWGLDSNGIPSHASVGENHLEHAVLNRLALQTSSYVPISISIISSLSFPVFFRRMGHEFSTIFPPLSSIQSPSQDTRISWKPKFGTKSIGLLSLLWRFFRKSPSNGINLQILPWGSDSWSRTFPGRRCDELRSDNMWPSPSSPRTSMDAESMWSRGHEMDGIWMGFIGLLSWFERHMKCHTSYHCSSRSESGSLAVNSYSIWMLPWALLGSKWPWTSWVLTARHPSELPFRNKLDEHRPKSVVLDPKQVWSELLPKLEGQFRFLLHMDLATSDTWPRLVAFSTPFNILNFSTPNAPVLSPGLFNYGNHGPSMTWFTVSTTKVLHPASSNRLSAAAINAWEQRVEQRSTVSIIRNPDRKVNSGQNGDKLLFCLSGTYYIYIIHIYIYITMLSYSYGFH